MKKIVTFVTILALVAGISTAALAQRGAGRMMGPGPDGKGNCDHPGFRGPGMILHMKAELDLTDDQVAKMQKINFAHQETMIDMKAELRKAQLKMRQEELADNPDKLKVLSAAREVNTIKGKMQEERIGHRFQMRELLNPEQLEKLKKSGFNCHGDGPGFGRGMGPCQDGPRQGPRGDHPRRGDCRR